MRRFGTTALALLTLLALCASSVDLAYAAPLNYAVDTTVSIITPATDLVIAAGSVADSLTTNETGLSVTLSSSTGGSFVVRSSSYDLQVAASASGGTANLSCSGGVETATLSQNSGSTTYTVTTGGTSCSNPVTSGGGGGGPEVPVPITPTTPTSTPSQSAPSCILPRGQSADPSASLVNDKGTFYLVDATGKLGITNPGILESYGYTFKSASTATASQITLPSLGNLAPNNGALVKSAKDRTVYLISCGKRFGFTSGTVFLGLGYKFSSVLVVTWPELNQLPVAPALSDSTKAHLPGANVLLKGTVYWIGRDDMLHAYPSLAVYNSWNIPNDFSTVVPANAADQTLPIGTVETTRT